MSAASGELSQLNGRTTTVRGLSSLASAANSLLSGLGNGNGGLGGNFVAPPRPYHISFAPDRQQAQARAHKVTVWESRSQPGSFGMNVPNKGIFRVQHEAEAQALLHSLGMPFTPPKPPKAPPATPSYVGILRSTFAELGDDLVVCDKQPLRSIDVAAVWPSQSKPGTFSVRIPGAKDDEQDFSLEDAKVVLNNYFESMRMIDLTPELSGEERTRLKLRAMLTDMEGSVQVLDKRPPEDAHQAAIWPSASEPGAIGVRLPGGGDKVVESVEHAKQLLAPLLSARGAASSKRDPTQAELDKLAADNHLKIEPLVVNGKEIGHVLRSADPDKQTSTLMISSHGNGKDRGTFTKPDGLNFRFAAKSDTILRSSTKRFCDNYKDGQAAFTHPSQKCDEPGQEVTDYRLSGGIGTTVDEVADGLGRMHKQGCKLPFDMVLLKPSAQANFSDVVKAVQAIDGNAYEKMVCHFCRPETANAKDFNALAAMDLAAPGGRQAFKAKPQPWAVPLPTANTFPQLPGQLHNTPNTLIPPGFVPPVRKHYADAREEVLDKLGQPAARDNLSQLRPGFRNEEFGMWTGSPVRYLNAKQRQGYAATFIDGRIFVHEEPDNPQVPPKLVPFDSRKSFGSLSAGGAICVQDPCDPKKWYFTNKQRAGKFHHSTFLAGAPVPFAGEPVCHDGYLKSLNNSSNHYQPGQAQLMSGARDLQAMGVPKFDVLQVVKQNGQSNLVKIA
jgi:hypothetical protein